MKVDQLRGKFVLIIVSSFLTIGVQANPDAKRLYDDLLSNYNRLIRPVMNNTDTILVKLGLRLSQLIDLVSITPPLKMDEFDSFIVYDFRLMTITCSSIMQ